MFLVFSPFPKHHNSFQIFVQAFYDVFTLGFMWGWEMTNTENRKVIAESNKR